METFKISELANEFDVTTRSIRFYEEQGLLHPTRNGTVRVYQRRDKVRLKLILRGKRLGFSLDEIRELFELYDTNQCDTQLMKMLDIIDEKQATLRRQLKDIDVVMHELDNAKERCLQALNRSSSEKVANKTNAS
ncbi:MerR family DNA-binding transcriptional regulator [Vibrio sp. S4M6]|uniref:MerR family transcriptional regulator n=1 Tax=Vibrio sinus TaxID=2946865 RepID=UPI00202A0706|nr:MerR family DNA-binding transcriptional regulator [Vibrio sinus]MCL9781969.1 MerR family DNA-binding transcriptional regulator [Vibrio sinus]